MGDHLRVVEKPVWFLWLSPQNGGTSNTLIRNAKEGFPGGAVVENLPANAGDTGSGPDLGRSHMPRSN